MTKENQKRLLQIGGVLLGVGVIGYLLVRREKLKSELEALTKISNADGAIISSTKKPIQQPRQDIFKVETLRATLLPAQTLLEESPKFVNGKLAYSKNIGLPIYNKLGKVVRQTKTQNELLGLVFNSESGNRLWVMDNEGNELRVPTTNVYIKVN